MTYHEFVYGVLCGGITCGLKHPIEWLLNDIRIRFQINYAPASEEENQYGARFLVEMFDCDNMRKPESADEVLAWCDKKYEKNALCQGAFEHLRTFIEAAVKEGS